MGKSNAEEYLGRAEKKASSSVGWFGSASNKWEEAGDLFAQVRPTIAIAACTLVQAVVSGPGADFISVPGCKCFQN